MFEGIEESRPKRKGGVKRPWRCPSQDPPAQEAIVEIIGHRDVVVKAYYYDECFFVDAKGKTTVQFLNVLAWRELAA